MYSKADTAVRHVKAQEMLTVISFEDNLLMWTFRKGKEKIILF